MSRSVLHRVPPGWQGRPLREFLRRGLGLSARSLTELKTSPGGLLRNGHPCRTVDILVAGDTVQLCFPEERAAYPPVEGPLEVLWEDQDYLVADKPSATPVYPTPGHHRDSLLNRVAYHYGQTGQSPGFHPLYRLDKDTSGLLVIGKHRAAVSSARVDKAYFAVCQGELSGQGQVDAPIGLAPGSKIQRRCGGEGARPACTHWRALAARDGHTLLALTLETGRTHQIRVHMAALGHPLAGDDLYGGSRALIGRQALHCGRLTLCCPVLHTVLELHAPLPRDMAAAFPWAAAVLECDNKGDDRLCPPV